MPECTNPIWPCALTGAAAFLAGFRGLPVVIHGSSGCYYYPRSLIKAPLNGSFILEEEVIFGTGDRLRIVVSEVLGGAEKVAVVNSCVPSLMGEDLQAELSEYPVVIVDAPGFRGGAEVGYRIASEALLREAGMKADGVNIGGICLLDPFYRGNMHESRRLLMMAGVPIGAVISCDQVRALSHLSPVTVSTNPDYHSSIGRDGGSLLGFSAIRKTIAEVAASERGADPSPVLAECDAAEELAIASCEKFLRRNDPPSAAICAQAGYAAFFSDLLIRYFGAARPLILQRNDTDKPAVTSYDQIADALREDAYTLLLGSSYEARLMPDAGFVGITPPDRGRVILGSPPVAGIEGTLNAIEMILNALLDKKKKAER